MDDICEVEEYKYIGVTVKGRKLWFQEHGIYNERKMG